MPRARAGAGRIVGLLVKTWPKLSETFVLEEVLGLERLGVPLRLYALQAPTDAIEHPDTQRVRAPLARVPAWREPEVMRCHRRLFVASPARWLATLARAATRGRAGLRDFARAGWLACRLVDDGVDHLHTHFISTPADLAELASRLAGVPFSISAHAKDIWLAKPGDLRRKLNAARFTVTCTDCNRGTLSAIAPDAPVRLMYHGIDHRQFHPRLRETVPPRERPLLLSVGRLRDKKGLDLLIDACALLRDRGVDVDAEIVGYGEEEARLRARIQARSLGGRVALAGKLPRAGVIACYSRAAVYVQPSRVAADGDRDGIPNVLLEAMAMQLPVVATRVSGIPELVRHLHNGMLVQPDDAVALADAIERLLRDPTLASELGRRARATVIRQFDNDLNLQLLIELLESADERSPRLVPV